MKIKNLLLVCSLFLAGGVVATGAEQANNVKAEVVTGSATYSCTTSGTDLDAGVEKKLDEYVAIKKNSGSDNNYYNPVRIYANSEMLFYGLKSNVKITSVSIKCSSRSYFNDLTGNDTVNPSATDSHTSPTATYDFTSSLPNEVSITSKKQYRVSSFTVNYQYENNSATYDVSFDASPSAFVEGKGATESFNTGVEGIITTPLLSDLENEGKFDNGYAQVTGWKATFVENEEEVEKTFGFGEEVTVTTYTSFETTYGPLNQNISIADAISIGENCSSVCEYSVEGEITNIGTAHGTYGDNISLTISDGTDSIYCYSMAGGSDLYEGYKIRVTGKLSSHNSAAQFVSSRYTILEQDSASDLFVKELTTTKLTAAYDSEVLSEESGTYSYEFTAKNYSENNTSKSLGDRSWTFNGTASGTPYFGNFDSTKGNQYGSKDSPFSTINLVSDSAFAGVTSIEINTSGASGINATLSVTVGGTQIGNSVTLTNVATVYTFESDVALDGVVAFNYTIGARAVYIKTLSIDYSAQEKSYTLADASVGFASLIREVSYDANANYGILVVPTEELGSNTVASYVSTDVNALVASLTAANVRVANYPCEPVKVDANGDADENGEFYQFGVLFENCLANIDFSLTAVAYMEVNGQVYLTSNQSSYSLRSLAQAYIDAGTMAGNPDAVAVLDAIVNY